MSRFDNEILRVVDETTCEACGQEIDDSSLAYERLEDGTYRKVRFHPYPHRAPGHFFMCETKRTSNPRKYLDRPPEGATVRRESTFVPVGFTGVVQEVGAMP